MSDPTPSFEDARRAQAFLATTPTWGTRFRRTFLPWQMVRFAVINLKMIRIILKSH